MAGKNKPVRFKRRAPISDALRWPNVVYINKATEPQPGVGETRTSPAPAFQPDGFIYPTSDVTFFDVIVRQPQLPVSTVTTLNVFTQEERVKGGWIRALGYGFNNKHGYFKVRTTLRINGGSPSNYIYKTVDPTTGTYQGSFPTMQLGGIENPYSVFIYLPANARVDIEWDNQSTVEQFSAAVRLWGWSFGS